MTITRNQTAILAGIIILVAAGAVVLMSRKSGTKSEPEKIAATLSRIDQASAGLPDPQIQGKALVMTAMIQKAIPAVAGWCETLNAGNKLWPVTPTNTYFALNSQMAGTAYARGMRADAVAFFETATAGWNQAGGAELLANKPEVTVVMVDGRALVMSHDDAVKLRWAP